MTGGIVLCYRTEEAGAWARELRDRLATEFGEGRIVALSDALASVPDIERYIADRVDGCAVCLPIIGNSTEGAAKLREDSSDIVGQVVARALASGRRMIPVLIGGARMPSASELPATLAPFASRQAVAVGPQLTIADARMLTLAIREGREGDLTTENVHLMIAAAFSVIAPQLFYRVENALFEKFDLTAMSNLYDYRFVIGALTWGACFAAIWIARRLLIARRGSRITEPERTVLRLAGILLVGSGLLAALRIVFDLSVYWPPHPVSGNGHWSINLRSEIVYAAGCILGCLLIAAGNFRRFSERGAQLSQVEWFICCVVTFAWTYFVFPPMHAILNNNGILLPVLARVNEEVIQIAAGLAMALLVAMLARAARRRVGVSQKKSA